MIELALTIAFGGLLFLGVIFALIPGVPAVLYMFLVAVTFGFSTNFSHMSRHELLYLGLIYLVSFCVDSLSGALGAKYGGAAFRSMLAGIFGALLGTLLLPPLGGIAGLFIGVLVSEWLSHGQTLRAVRAATFGMAGAVAGMAVNAVLAVLFFSLFVWFVFF